MDPMERPGPEAMAVDEWLLETAEQPVLRVYGWQGAWGTVGYFGKLADAGRAFPGVDWVRRWTGGGTVDHRADWTYTLVVPAGFGMDQARGVESYRQVHGALAEALVAEGVAARLSSGDEETGLAACFQNPVGHDVMGPGGKKLAGAGQRRGKRGLLHQGSVALPCDDGMSLARGRRLAGVLAQRFEVAEIFPAEDEVRRLVAARYGNPVWTERR
nr:hypothetical protein [Verrucomicrobiota bacterium JB025]